MLGQYSSAAVAGVVVDIMSSYCPCIATAHAYIIYEEATELEIQRIITSVWNICSQIMLDHLHGFLSWKQRSLVVISMNKHFFPVPGTEREGERERVCVLMRPVCVYACMCL